MENSVSKQIVDKGKKHCQMETAKHAQISKRQANQGHSVNGQSVKILKEITYMLAHYVRRARHIQNQHQQLRSTNTLK